MANTPDNTIPAGGVRQGRPSGPPFCFLIRERGPFGMPGREKPCVHAGELWCWRRDQGKRQERATRSPGRSWRRYALDLCRMICLNPVRHAVRKTVSSTLGAAGMARQLGE